MSDIMGLTMVVDYNTNQKPDGAFESSVLGPFYRPDAPWIDIGGDICRQKDVGTPALVSGRELSTDGSRGRNAGLDIWQVSANGIYENMDPSQGEFNCRGRLRAAEDGRFRFWTVKPVPYPILKVGLAGLILNREQPLNIRSANIDRLVEAAGKERVIGDSLLAWDRIFTAA